VANVGYDSGLAIVRTALRCVRRWASLRRISNLVRGGNQCITRRKRRGAREEWIVAALKSLGRSGLCALIERRVLIHSDSRKPAGSRIHSVE